MADIPQRENGEKDSEENCSEWKQMSLDWKLLLYPAHTKEQHCDISDQGQSEALTSPYTLKTNDIQAENKKIKH